jgi:UDP-GlcNAc:undecaprenyl-phosphate GlcNAc-1-phosphate transferase
MRAVLTVAFLCSAAAVLVLVPLVRWVAVRTGFVDEPGGRKAHRQPVPLGGGVALLVGTLGPVLGAAILSWLWQRDASLFSVPAALQGDVARAAERLPLVLKVCAGGLAVAGLGFWDDLQGMKAPTKLAAQFAIATAVALVPDVRITLFIHVGWVQVAVTAVWIVLMMNSFNLLDNMDGQSALVAFLCGGALLVLALQTAQYFIAGLLLALLGSLAGFLAFNLPPAVIFMGDTGSMFIGYVLAVATTLTAFLTTRAVNPFFPVLVPLVVFAVPLYDVLSVIAIRLHKGKPLLEGDRSHVSHRLMRLGMGERTVLLTVGLMVLATSPGATIPYGSSTWRVFVPALQALAVLLVIILLELVSARRGTEAAQ